MGTESLANYHCDLRPAHDHVLLLACRRLDRTRPGPWIPMRWVSVWSMVSSSTLNFGKRKKKNTSPARNAVRQSLPLLFT
jgi:hypothetical protein